MKTQRTFIIGDQWIYYKIYCGTKTADYILSEIIHPLTEELKAKDIIDQWFFIRYQDPDQHIRVRFKCSNLDNIGKVIATMHLHLKELIDQELVWKVQMDPYHRELERYGSNSIEYAEKLFYFDSEMTVKFIDLIDEGPEGDEIRWLFALKSIDAFLIDFKYTLETRKNLLLWLKTDFATEFHSNKYLKKQVNDRYRKYRNKIEGFMSLNKENAGDYTPLFKLIEERSSRNTEAVIQILNLHENGDLEMNINELLASFIHMIMNRLFKSKNRVHEMIGYDFLFRHYMADISKSKKKQPAKVLVSQQ